jgi:hypothetical protein
MRVEKTELKGEKRMNRCGGCVYGPKKTDALMGKALVINGVRICSQKIKFVGYDDPACDCFVSAMKVAKIASAVIFAWAMILIAFVFGV